MKMYRRVIFIVILMGLIVIIMKANYNEQRKTETSKIIYGDEWYNSVCKRIEESEYEIKGRDSEFESYNRANGIRFIYRGNEFEAISAKSDNDWRVRIELSSYGREIKEDIRVVNFTARGNELKVAGEKIDIEYKNEIRGMREDFILKNREVGDGEIELTFKVSGDADYEIEENGIIFKKANNIVMEYNELYVYDSKGKELISEFEEISGGFKIKIDDRDAVYPIRIDPLSASPNWMKESNQAYAAFGISVSSAGDVNGDGYDDVIVGANGYNNGEIYEGSAFVYYGSSTGLSMTSAWMGESNQESAYYGTSVSSAGDVNGDGYDDVITGAYGYENGESGEGKAYVYYGSSTGLSTTADWTGEGNQVNAYYGYRVSSAGDVNGDGYDDVIISALDYDNGETDEGRAYVYYGSSTGLSTTAAWTSESNQVDSRYGIGVSSAGDVNGDGYDDVVVGASFYDNGETNEGKAYVYYGSSTGLSTTPDWTLESNQSGAYYGFSVSSAGDVNGDGYDDVIIGAYSYDNGETDEGRAYVYYGSSTGLSITPDWMLESNQAGACYGFRVSSAGDVNGDGYDDVIVGAYFYSNDQTNEGRALVYYGSSTGLSTIAAWTGESNKADSRYGGSVSSAGDINGDGYDDMVVGAYYYTFGQTNEGAVFSYNGGMTFKTSPSSYDFSNLETNYEYSSNGLYFKNMEPNLLYVDSSKYTYSGFYTDSRITFPAVMDSNDSIDFKVNAFSTDTGYVTGKMYIYYTLYGKVYKDSISFSAEFDFPLLIDSAKAFDGTNALLGIDGDDYVLLYFNQVTNKSMINYTNIDSVLSLSDSHTWLDGSGVIDTIIWNTAGDILSVYFSTLVSSPTISVGDTIYPDSSTISSEHSGFKCHYPTVLTGSFSPSGVSDLFLKDKTDKNNKNLLITSKEVRYRIINENNKFEVYDVAGKNIYKINDVKPGIYRYSKSYLQSGIYFIKLKDGEMEINGKIMIMR